MTQLSSDEAAPVPVPGIGIAALAMRLDIEIRSAMATPAEALAALSGLVVHYAKAAVERERAIAGESARAQEGREEA